MKKRIITLIAIVTLVLVPVAVFASDPVSVGVCQAQQNTTDPNCNPSTPSVLGAGGFVSNLIHVLIYAVGAISVIMVIIGGLRNVLSGGDSAGVKGAKDTILYALIGLAVSILSFTIVQFVIGRIG